MKSVCFILGTRPETIKLYPVIKAFKGKFKTYIIHTGQHFDFNMQGQFFKDLRIKPDFFLNLNTKKFSRKIFINKLTIKLSRLFISLKPDFIINQGDTDSVRCSVLAFNKIKKKIFTKLVHVEAGIRSFDKKMPEENNRILADKHSDFLFAPTAIAKKNLLKERVKLRNIFIVGNTISDSINLFFKKKKIIQNYIYLTLHRVETVKIQKRLILILKTLEEISMEEKIKIIFPAHPRTKKIIRGLKIKKLKKIKIINPCSYKKSLNYINNARLVVTDSGGLQEEACILKTPCVTIRKNTERPETLQINSNFLTGYNKKKIRQGIFKMISKIPSWKQPYGQNVSKKILNIILKNAKYKK